MSQDRSTQLVEEREKLTPAQRWVQRMLKSAKQYHKLCPYFDKKTVLCFIKLGAKCDRDGKFESCQVFVEFLERKYEEYSSRGRVPPMDFLDITV